MGCGKEKIRKLLLSSFITALLFLAITTPIINAATTDYIYVTFDPDGAVDLNVSPNATDAALGTITPGGSEECTTEYTLWNNGTATMTTTADTNGSTAALTLDPDGSPVEDYFSIQLTNTGFGDHATVYVTDDGAEINGSLSPSLQSAVFYVTVHLGYISVNHAAQKTMINFTGAVAS